MTDPAAAGRGLAARLRRMFEAIDVALCKLNRIQFDAPWKERGTRRC
jgi:hypothetical protein